MSIPTLKELGLKDNRCKVPESIKLAIKEDLKNGITNMSYLAKKYGVSVCTVRMCRNYKYERSLINKSLDKKGGYKAYYNKEKHSKCMKKVKERKEQKIKELLDFYNKHKED